MKFDEKLYQLRINRNLSQEKLAEQLSVSRQTIAKWEAGKAYPEIDRLLPLSRFFGVSVDELLDASSCKDFTVNQKIRTPNEQLISFLLLAKRSTYPANGIEQEPSRVASHDYFFEKGTLAYADSYFGSDIFSGQEIVYENKIPVWSMNYMGRIVGKGFSSDFLKEALLASSKMYPYRGPLLYANGQFTYHNKVNGTFEWYEGNEEIYYSSNKIYECKYHGGDLT